MAAGWFSDSFQSTFRIRLDGTGSRNAGCIVRMTFATATRQRDTLSCELGRCPISGRTVFRKDLPGLTGPFRTGACRRGKISSYRQFATSRFAYNILTEGALAHFDVVPSRQREQGISGRSGGSLALFYVARVKVARSASEGFATFAFPCWRCGLPYLPRSGFRR